MSRTMTRQDSKILELVHSVQVEAGHGPDPAVDDRILKLMAERCFACVVRANEAKNEAKPAPPCDCGGGMHKPDCFNRIP